MEKRWMRKTCVFLLAAGILSADFSPAEPVRAQLVNGDDEIREAMDLAFSNDELEVCITTERTFSVNPSQRSEEAESYAGELVGQLEESALDNGRLLEDTSYTYNIEDGRYITYRFDISSLYTKKVTVLSSEKAAYQQALSALRRRDYSTRFYSEGGMYYDTFLRAIRQHPEYNYDLVIWTNPDGTCGYRPGKAMDASAIAKKMDKADEKARAILDRIIYPGMSKRQKLAAIHDYMAKNCVFDTGVPAGGYDDSYTAYGCLIKKKAVCQGYAAAFNLLSYKAGISSLAVLGEAGGGSHSWNYVKVGDDYRYIDVTWDDPIPDRGPDYAGRKYFYLTQSGLRKTHSWDRTESAKKYLKYTEGI